MKILCVIPARDEEKTIAKALESILQQSLVPGMILVLDDGSVDETASVVDRMSGTNPIIHRIKREGNARESGGHIVDLIYEGISFAEKNHFDWDFLIKMDADIELLDMDYIEYIYQKFSQNPVLGIASGELVYDRSDIGNTESKYQWKTWGAFKFYRKSCLDQIGGLKRYKGWDGMDDVLARHLGFITQRFSMKRMLHYYQTQSRVEEGGVYKGIEREIIGYRNRGYPILFVLSRSFRVLRRKPFLLLWAQYIIITLKTYATRPVLATQQEVGIIRSHVIRQLSGKFNYVD